MHIIIVVLILTGLVVQGVLEQNENEKNLKKIPIRVNVNGIRGKSTATRMISSLLIPKRNMSVWSQKQPSSTSISSAAAASQD